MLIDNLSYQYENNNTSNRLQKITDASQNITGYPYKANPTDIGYDVNGNMTSFQDKGISSIQYNYLNLPKQITQNSVVTNYTYRADGVKVKKLFGSVETHYLDGFQYKYTEPWEDMNGTMLNAEMKLRTIPTSEGYFDSLLNLYVYNYTDHLGNVRISYADSDHDGNIKGRDERIQECWGGNCLDYFIPGEVVDNNAYYPFGMLLENHNYYATNSNAYKYKYNGKELQETGMYDYGARFYMPDIGRWGVVDPLAEKMTRHSPYNYAFNNPIRFIDPDGRQGKDIIILTENGSFKASKGLMYKTEEGKRIWDKYGTSKTDDVYIKSSTFSSKDSRTGAETYSLAGDESFVKDGKINDIGKTYSAMESFNGVDISKSGDKQVHLMAINESFFPNETSDSYSRSEVTSSGKTITSEYNLSDLTKTVYHEFKAHIEDRTGDADKDHKNFGESTFQGYIRPNSPMDIFDKQLIKVIKSINEKKYNEKK